jgi:Cu+-exporting ATPase
MCEECKTNQALRLAKTIKSVGGEWSLVKDPVCGMNVNENMAKLKSEYKGKTFYFCNQSCKAMFDKNPTRYVGTRSGH